MTDQVAMHWADLNPDLLHQIAKKMGDISNLVHFRAVCKPWRSATYLVHVPQFPWLLAESRDTNSKLKIEFHSLSSGKTYTSRFPEAQRSKHIFQPSEKCVQMRGPVLNLNDDFLIYSFLNPLTFDEVLLPLKADGHSSFPICLGSNLIKNNRIAVWCYSVSKDIAITANYVTHNYLSIWLNENKKWTTHQVPWTAWKIAYWRDNLFVRSKHNSKNMKVIEKTTGNVLSKIRLPDRDIRYLISVGDDSLLAIKQNVSIEKPHFEVYRLDKYKEKPHWTKLSEIGDTMLFLDEYNGFGLKASDFDGFRENCIYFIIEFPEGGKKRTAIGRYDMKKNKTERVPLPAGFGKNANGVSWFIPTLS